MRPEIYSVVGAAIVGMAVSVVVVAASSLALSYGAPFFLLLLLVFMVLIWDWRLFTVSIRLWNSVGWQDAVSSYWLL